MIEFLAESNRIDISNVNRSSNHAALPDNLSENRSYKSGYVYWILLKLKVEAMWD